MNGIGSDDVWYNTECHLNPECRTIFTLEGILEALEDLGNHESSLYKQLIALLKKKKERVSLPSVMKALRARLPRDYKKNAKFRRAVADLKFTLSTFFTLKTSIEKYLSYYPNLSYIREHHRAKIGVEKQHVFEELLRFSQDKLFYFLSKASPVQLAKPCRSHEIGTLFCMIGHPGMPDETIRNLYYFFENYLFP